jgi:uncharacterized repeat protein (TIGR03803 family)
MRPTSISAVSKNLLAFAFVLGLVLATSTGVQSQTFSVVHSFDWTDGANPLGGLVMDASGNFYGTTSNGGAYSKGDVFKLSSTGVVTVLYSFTGGDDGGGPGAALILVGPALYGTAATGGTKGGGTVFEVALTGTETVLYNFGGQPDGSNPGASLTRDSKGNFYSTTTGGGVNGNGTVFELIRPTSAKEPWIEQVLYSFGKGTDGTDPVSGVNFDATGNLYGTTSAGGTYGYGTVFELKPSTPSWTETNIHQFALQADGGIPYAGIVLDRAGNLYGATTDGGGGGSEGGGTVFEMTSSNGVWTFSVLYSLPGWGISGSFRDVLLTSNKIYATTHCDGANSAGTVYELTHSKSGWAYTSLYVFSGGSDGMYSFSNLILDKLGNLYGTMRQGGANGDGVIFKVQP